MVARYYCRAGGVTFSLLPDCFPSRLPGSLAELERVVVEAETEANGGGTRLAVASRIRPELDAADAVRWLDRRVRAVHACLRVVIGLLPVLLAGCLPTVLSVRARLGAEWLLPVLREKAGPHMSVLPSPLGFGPRPERRRPRPSAVQHDLDAEPLPPPLYTPSCPAEWVRRRRCRRKRYG